METTDISTNNYIITYDCDEWVKKPFYDFLKVKIIQELHTIFDSIGLDKTMGFSPTINNTKIFFIITDTYLSLGYALQSIYRDGDIVLTFKEGLISDLKVSYISMAIAFDSGTETSKPLHILDRAFQSVFDRIAEIYSEFLEGFDESRAIRSWRS